MNPFKQLASQTAVYGLSSIIGRLLGYLLVPIYTRALDPALYARVIDLYIYIAFFLVILTYGMETTFFRFSQKAKKPENVFSTAFLSIIFSSVAFVIAILFSRQSIADLLLYHDFPEYISMLALILFFDSINAIPYARLRIENKARKFVTIKLVGIFSNIGLNLFFVLLVPYVYERAGVDLREMMHVFYSGEPVELVRFVFIVNVFSSGVQTLLFLPEWFKMKLHFDFQLWKKMIVYASPLLVFGLAGIVNEMIDRQMLKYMLKDSVSMEYAMTQVGIYGAVYKISILMTIFIQAYRYAAEPFFFAHEKEENSKDSYSRLLTYFVMVTSLIFLATMLYMDIIIYMIDDEYHVGRGVIPILLMANLFLGVFYNLSIWYKLTNRTRWGAYLALFGAAITFALNLYWIPRIGYVGSAWATIICYGSMTLLSFILGAKFYPVPYDYKRIVFYIGSSALLWYLSTLISYEYQAIKYAVNTLILFGFIGIIWLVDGRRILINIRER